MRNIKEFFGGGVRYYLGFCNRALCLTVATAIVFSLAGCGASKTGGTENAGQRTDYEAQTAIKKQIEDTPLPKGYATLLDDTENWVTVLVKDGEATVQIRSFMNYTIPYTAEVFLPIVQQAAEDAETTLSEFDVNSYNTNKDGVISKTWASWQSKDGGSTGTLTDETGGKTVVKPGLSLEQVFEYYADFDGIVKGMISEAGGSYE